MSVKALAENAICVFSRSWCPYCTRVKSLLDTRFPDAQRKYLELDKMDEGDDIQGYLQSKTGQRTVPNVFIKQKHIGGKLTLSSTLVLH
ncbi:glutaredoxin-domain-containing protein [Schizophyllum commune H4-8]|uniref:glutaredoxin-domain-containing protein n=1 Tax=Schizophyllum commune (strain H4-8 / FGSC 9210) TaxID=578458 RepID=UPI002160CC8F|nr:glutaredoxin-domain-containing protein [Schizophyllum commune H4-8]KAI5897268.1 glutaredoxin-domain-containing protein [Schizophyllum commune H4-8]